MNIYNNTITNTGYFGILSISSTSEISENYINDVKIGILHYDSESNSVDGNKIENLKTTSYSVWGILLKSSKVNVIKDNIIQNTETLNSISALHIEKSNITGITGNNIKETAKQEYQAKGSMTAEVQGGTQLTLKGAMVSIN